MRNVWKELQDWNEAKAAHYERLADGYTKGGAHDVAAVMMDISSRHSGEALFYFMKQKEAA